VKDVLQRWTLRVVFLKDREYCVLQERRDKALRFVISHTSLWIHVTTLKASLTAMETGHRAATREHKFNDKLSGCSQRRYISPVRWR
jgi:hypothetical protein